MLPKVSIKSIRHEGKLDKELPKHSGFFITATANSLKPSSSDEAEAMGDDLENAMRAAFDQERIKDFVTFLDDSGSWNTQYIDDVQGEFSIELGETAKGSRIHAHAAIHIYHHSRIRLKIDVLQDFLSDYLIDNSQFAIKGKVYVNVRMIKGDTDLKSYIRKKPV